MLTTTPRLPQLARGTSRNPDRIVAHRRLVRSVHDRGIHRWFLFSLAAGTPSATAIVRVLRDWEVAFHRLDC